MSKERGDAAEPEKEIAERATDPGFWQEVWQQLRLVFYLLRDPDVPIYLKLLPLAAVLYVLVPIDFLPDFYPMLGQVDDLTALVVGAKVFIEMAPPHVVARHLQAMQAGSSPEELDELKDAIIIDAEHELVEKPEDKLRE